MNFSKTEGTEQVVKMCRQYLFGLSTIHIPGKIVIHKLHPQAEFPSKEKVSNATWDITIINRVENRAEDEIGEINEFGTGLQFEPPEGYFLEFVANNTLHRHGYMMTGPVIIDRGDKGELILPLYKFRESADDIQLPFRAGKLITRPLIYSHISHFSSKKKQRQSSISSTYAQMSSESYPPGMPRPHAIAKGGNHMF